MRSYFFFNSICGALGLGFLLGTVLVWRGSAVEAGIENNMVAEVPMIEKLEIRNLKLGEEKQQGTRNKEQVNHISQNDDLPKRLNLNVPFTSQAPEKNWDQPWQDACEEAAVLMLDAYYKGYNLSPLFAKDEILKMIAWEDARGWQYSIEIEKVKKLIEGYLGYQQKLKIVENPTISEIKRSVAAGHPVLVVAHGKALPNPYFRDGGPDYHALIIRGYTEDSFITNDPGTWRGENFVYKYEEMMNAIHDWNDGEVKSGREVILVVQ